MAVIRFPNPRKTTSEGLLALGGNLELETLISAYSQGIFPWPMPVDETEEPVLAWFCPPQRAILRFEDFKTSRSFDRWLKKPPYKATLDQNFESVIRKCQQTPRPGQDGTWITDEMLEAYLMLHRAGFAHSIEVWEQDQLVGGVYGVGLGHYFSAESMFREADNASKYAVWALVEHLKKEGCSWMDVQIMTPHLEKWGARLIKRDLFLKMVAETV